MAFSTWLLVLGSCSTNKNVSTIRNLSANHIIREVERNQFEFENIETKFNVKVKGDNSIGLKGQIRMQNDSVIWISLSMKLGIEVARVMITEDSVKFINRTEKTYLSESINGLKDRLPIETSLDFLQDLLIGNNIHFNEKYKATVEDNSYKLTSDRDIFWVTPKTFKVKEHELQSSMANSQQLIAKIYYDNFQEINGKLLPTKIILDASDIFDLNIEIDYSDIKVGEKLQFPFNISKKYSKI